MFRWISHQGRTLAHTLLGLFCTLVFAVGAQADVLRVGVYQNVPKISLSDEGRISGIFGDLLSAIAEREGWTLQPVPCQWDRCLALLQQGELDLLPDVAFSDERARLMAFHSEPVLRSWSQLFTTDNRVVESPLDLAGLRIAVLSGSIQLEYLRKLTNGFDLDTQFVEAASLRETFTLVATGDADVAVANQLFGDYHAAEYALRPTSLIFQPIKLYFATPLQQHEALRERLDYWLSRWRHEPDSPYYAVLDDWTSGVPYNMPSELRWGLTALVLLLVCALAFVILLRLKVREKTRHLQLSENRLNTILGSVDAYIFIKDTEYRYRYVNPKVVERLGCHENDILGQRDERFFDADTVSQLREADRRVLELGERVVEEELHHRPGEDERIYLAVKQPLRNGQGEVTGLVGVSTDITERRRNEKQIHQLAFYDSLTGLPNQRLLRQQLDHAVASAARSDREGAVLFIDLDNFRDLNDTLGHQAGDELLKAVAERLDLRVREGDTLARFGGDEFIVVLEGMDGDRDEVVYQVEHTARQLLDLLDNSVRLGKHQYTASASIGIALFSDAGHRGNELIKSAELAMYDAKASGRAGLRFFDPSMQAQVNARAELEAGIRRGLGAGEFQLYYQPQYHADGELLGLEALVRWQHPEQGLVSPAAFIPVAEASGLILPLGDWILREACSQLVRWSGHPQLSTITIAVNISAAQMLHAGFVSGLLALLEETGADPNRLKLELTESMLAADIEQTIAKMQALGQRGVRFSLDDFGTGYSSLSYLKRLPLSQLKIDQSFVRDLLRDSNDAAIVRTIVALGESLDLSVIAEGVETTEQRAALLGYGCRRFQGYLYSRPLPVDELEQRVGAESS